VHHDEVLAVDAEGVRADGDFWKFHEEVPLAVAEYGAWCCFALGVLVGWDGCELAGAGAAYDGVLSFGEVALFGAGD